MNELALFAGAGGGILAGSLLGWRTICAVEQNKVAASVLVQRQNEGLLYPFPVWDDIRTFNGANWAGLVDVVSGGFPCQAFSSAARGRNNAANLWGEMYRVVGEVKPNYVFAENVAKKAIQPAADDLKRMGYSTKIVALSARDLGADHLRKRYWLLAYTNYDGKLLGGVNAETRLRSLIRHSVWSPDPTKRRVADGLAGRMERHKLCGNGQVPIVAATALCLMAKEIEDGK